MNFLDFFDFSLGNLTVTLGSSALAVWGWVKWFGEKKIDHKFNKQLEEHRSELQRLRDQNSFELGRKLADFNLYSSKKHEVYPRVYSSMKTAFQALMTLKSCASQPDGVLSDKMKTKQFFEYIKVPKEQIDNMLDQWSGLDSYKQRLYDYFIKCLFAFANSEITFARDCFFGNSLYLSEDIEKMCFEIVSEMNLFVDVYKEIKYKDMEHGHQLEAEWQMIHHQDNVILLLNRIKEQMRNEMRKGYYDDNTGDD